MLKSIIMSKPDKPLSPRLITFDFGDTLVTSEPEYLERTALGLTELGYEKEVKHVKKAYFEADLLTASELLPKAPFTTDDFQRTFGRHFFEGLGLHEEYPTIGPPLRDFLIGFRPQRVMMPGAIELLDKLHDAGYALGIISNNDGNTREKCEDVGIDDKFMFILDSTIEGVNKPDPRIFLKALATANVKSGEVLHVGDLWGCDVMGAKRAGIPAVWLGNDFVTPELEDETYRIENLLELLELVES